MASPRPGTSATAQKSLAYKSPAVKTPASAHGHAHNISVSSHPSSTPLAANAIRDELLNLDSPAAALINSIASGQDGLGITTHPQGTPARDTQAPRSPEAQRLHRLQQVVNALKSKMVGRGVTREGVERVAHVQGFEALWDDDILTIAGNIVELEITFDPLIKHKVSDIVLKFNTADGESHTQQEATTVLRAQVGVSDPIEDLGDFSMNVEYLAQMDRIDTTPNSFEVTGRLYETFRHIWEEEKKRMKWKHEAQHLCRSSIGRPSLDSGPRLGVKVDYWREKQNDDTDALLREDENEIPASVAVNGLKQARISCEAGPPSISSTLKWVSPKILDETEPDNVLDEVDNLQQPAWLASRSAADNAGQGLEGDLTTEQPTEESLKFLDAHFVCELDPGILVPLTTAIRLSTEHNMLNIDQEKATLYPQALQTTRNAQLVDHSDDLVEPRWLRQLPSRSGATTTHSYALFPATLGTELWFYPLSKLKFGHPRQLADAIPVLRQYTVLSALMRNLVTAPAPVLRSSVPSKPSDKLRVTKRSNRPAKLNGLDGTDASSQNPSAQSVDISLDVVSDPTACKLELIAALPTSAQPKKGTPFIHLVIVIRPNGVIDVSELSGVVEADIKRLKSKLSRMLMATEDIGLVLEWLQNEPQS
jgi:Mediator of RNA polymerase II transcription subunit 1